MDYKENSAFVDYRYEYIIFMNECIWKQEGEDLDEYVKYDPLKLLDFESRHQAVSSFYLACVIAMQYFIFFSSLYNQRDHVSKSKHKAID